MSPQKSLAKARPRKKIKRRVIKPPTLPMLRTSERSSFRFCRWVWNLSYNRHIEPQTAAKALRFGTLVHRSLAAYYIPGKKRGPEPAGTFQKLYDEELKEQEKFGFFDDDGKWEEAGELGVAMMENYIEQYGADDRWEVIATEQPFEVVVHKPECGICSETILTDKNGSDCSPNCPGPELVPWFIYAGVLDGVWRELSSGKLWIPDHKTTQGIGPETVKHLVLDDQAGAYWSWGVDWLYAQGILKPNQKLAGMLYNFMRKALPDERPYKMHKGIRHYLNKDGSVSQKQPSPYFLRQPIFRDEMDKQAAKTRTLMDYGEIEMVRKGVLQINKNPGRFTCSMCWAIDLCELHEAGHDWEEMLNGTTKAWDPYAEHEIYDAESR